MPGSGTFRPYPRNKRNTATNRRNPGELAGFHPQQTVKMLRMETSINRRFPPLVALLRMITGTLWENTAKPRLPLLISLPA